MFFNKFPHPSNFSFACRFDRKSGRFQAGGNQFEARIDTFEGGIFQVQIRHRQWTGTPGIVRLNPPPPCDCSPVEVDPDFGLRFRLKEGPTFLESLPKASFGVCGHSWLFQFAAAPGTRFYGMGEKNFGRLELSGIRTRFWNTDVWSDFHHSQWADQPVDPPYLSVPYVILGQGDFYCGILLDTPATSFIETPGRDTERVFAVWQKTHHQLIVGAVDGPPNLWVIYGPTLKELTRKVQHLMGLTPLPPLWALGYHQSRWGYAGQNDLESLDRRFEEEEIPCDGLWLDIDYMSGYRVFTVDKEHFPTGLQGAAHALGRNRRKVVAILDPGIKQEPGNPVYEDLKKKNLHCVNPEGKEFVGIVWPGETIYPDFTLGEARTWWAAHVSEMAADGLSAAWIDMNDPSTGPVDPTDMLFQHGTEAHALRRNEYALGMQIATREGFLSANPNQRPFVLSRSGSTGTSRFAAVWTGDNLSNYFYLKLSIPATLNLSLSGIPFNGPDVGGFGGSATEDLMVKWVKTCFLFPFMRNHSSNEAGSQEPWAFSLDALKTIRKFIRLRYKLLPYLYNLYVEHEEQGDPILRPLFYEFDIQVRTPRDTELVTKKTATGAESYSFEDIVDEFLVGNSILQAPHLEERGKSRRAFLPGSSPWFSLSDGKWYRPGSRRVSCRPDDSPVFLRSGAIVPMRPDIPTDNKTDLLQVDLLIAAKASGSGSSAYRYVADDGESFEFKQGIRSVLEVSIRWAKSRISIDVNQIADGFGRVRWGVVLSDRFERVFLNGKEVDVRDEDFELTGREIPLRRVS